MFFLNCRVMTTTNSLSPSYPHKKGAICEGVWLFDICEKRDSCGAAYAMIFLVYIFPLFCVSPLAIAFLFVVFGFG
jgi:hypothetical protein